MKYVVNKDNLLPKQRAHQADPPGDVSEKAESFPGQGAANQGENATKG
jgi:hypothetical protein